MQNEAALPAVFLRCRRNGLRLTLAFGGEGVVAVAVFFPDLAVFAVNQQFRALISGHGTPGINSLTLGGVHAAGAVRAATTNCPSIWMRNNMMIGFLGHGYNRI